MKIKNCHPKIEDGTDLRICNIMYMGTWPQIYTVLNFGMTIFNFHFLLLFLANLTSNWVIFDEKMERQA